MSLEERLGSVLDSVKKEYVKMIRTDIDIVFKSGNLYKIEEFTKILDKIHDNVQLGFRSTRPISYVEYKDRIEANREILIKVLKRYGPNQRIQRSELSKATGLGGRQLLGYSFGKNPTVIKEGNYYRPGRILKKDYKKKVRKKK